MKWIKSAYSILLLPNRSVFEAEKNYHLKNNPTNPQYQRAGLLNFGAPLPTRLFDFFSFLYARY